MSRAEKELWTRLQGYDFGDTTRHSRFSERLARQHGYALAFADRLAEEYLKFCFLAITASSEVTPSKHVDKAWHLHMLDSREYWGQFCREVLQQELHHRPSAGTDEDVRHRSQYEATVAAYVRFFGAPPDDIWPPADPPNVARPQMHPSAVWPRPAEVTPSPWFLVPPILIWAGAFLAEGAWSPLAWGPAAFLLLFMALIPLAGHAGGCLRRWTLSARVVDDKPPDAMELAFLAGGAQRVADTLIVEFMARKQVNLFVSDTAPRSASHAKLQWRGRHSAKADARLANAERRIRMSSSNAEAVEGVASLQADLRQDLIRRGLVPTTLCSDRSRVLGAMPPLLLLGFATLRLMAGLANDRPVGFLIALMLVIGLLVLPMLILEPKRTLAGDLALHNAASLVTREFPQYQVALLGTAVLADTEFAAYAHLRNPAPASGSNDSGAGGCGGGSCGGGWGGGCGGGCGG